MKLSRRSVLAASAALCSGCYAPMRPREHALDHCARPIPQGFPGFDAHKLEACLDTFLKSDVNYHGLVVERGGRLVVERYRNGADKPGASPFARDAVFDACALHDIRSISKSVTSLLWGIAAGQGKTPPLGAKVLDLYPNLERLKKDGREDITVRHLLTMTIGLKWDEENYGSLLNDEEGLYWTGDQPRYVLDRPMAEAPGARFNYCGGATAIVADLLKRATGEPLAAYAEKHLFTPLGITEWEWVRDKRGREAAFSGLRLKPRDMIRIGRMVLNDGRHGDTQVVPASWIADSIAPHALTADGLHYGYFWWLGEVDGLGASHKYVAGFGNGGQRLFMVRDLDLVVAITSGEYNKPAQRQSNALFKSIAAACS